MRRVFTTLVALLLAIMIVVPAAAQDRNLVEAAQQATGFSTLLAAAEAAGLAEELAEGGPYTIFAPTDGGFANALSALGLTAEELLADTELLTTILSFHVINGDFSSGDLVSIISNDADGVAEFTTLGGETLTAELVTLPVPAEEVAAGQPTPEPQFQTAIFLNGQGISVFLADIQASNGVLHAISGVLLPPSFTMMEDDMAMEEEMMEEEMAPATIADIAATTDGFSTLAAAVDAAGLTDALSEGNLTVFAPTDDAFAAALDALGLSAEELLADTDTLTTILTYHVIAGDFSSEDLLSLSTNGGITELNTLAGEPLSLAIEGDSVVIGGATVTMADIEADNGIVHVIDGVLLPPSMQ